MNAQNVVLSHVLVMLMLTPIGAQQKKPNEKQAAPDQSSDPATAQSTVEIIEYAFIITLVSDDEIYVNKVRLSREELVAEADRRLKPLPEESQIAYIKPWRDVSYGTVVGIIEDIRALGYDKIGLIKDRDERQRAAGLPSSRKTIPSEVRRSSVAKPQVLDVNQLAVTVDPARRGGIRVKVGETRVSLHALPDTVRARLRGREIKSVRIVAPATIRYSSIVAVIDGVKAGGAEIVGLNVKEP